MFCQLVKSLLDKPVLRMSPLTCSMTELWCVEGCPVSSESQPECPLERAPWGLCSSLCVLPEVFACNRGWQTLSTIASPETKKPNEEP